MLRLSGPSSGWMIVLR